MDGKTHVHDLDRMPLTGGDVDETPLREEVRASAISRKLFK